MASAVKADEILGPMDISLLGSKTVKLCTNAKAHLLDQAYPLG
jgi:hypothetical protein